MGLYWAVITQHLKMLIAFTSVNVNLSNLTVGTNTFRSCKHRQILYFLYWFSFTFPFKFSPQLFSVYLFILNTIDNSVRFHSFYNNNLILRLSRSFKLAWLCWYIVESNELYGSFAFLRNITGKVKIFFIIIISNNGFRNWRILLFFEFNFTVELKFLKN